MAVTGSIGALWAAQFILELRVRRLVDGVRVVMSASAAHLVTPAAMRAVSGAEVLTGLFDADAPFAVGHMQITEDADVIIVMPATANIIGKAANAIADEAVSAVIVAAACPVVFVPNMHERMWRNPLVQRNVKRLIDVGHHVVPPVSGPAVSTARYAVGGMPPFETIVNAARTALRGTSPLTSPDRPPRAKPSASR